MMTSSRYGEPIVPEGGDGRLTLADLQNAVWAADPAAFLVLPRIVRRVIKEDRQLAGFGLTVPHRKSYVIGREALLEIVDKADLGVDDDFELPERVILLARPGSQEFLEKPAGELLTRCWRLVFHARVHIALEAKLAGLSEEEAASKRPLQTPMSDISGNGSLSGGASCNQSAAIRRRIHEIGTTEFDEIRTVLAQENLLLPPPCGESIYVEFAATYLELRRFAASFLPRYFPGLEDLAAIDELIGRDVDGEGLFHAARPAGAPDPTDLCVLDEWSSLTAEGQPHTVGPPAAEIPSETKYRIMMRRSLRPAALGNVVRAAIYHARAARCAPPEFAGRVRSAIKMDVEHLIRRLQAALELEQSSPQSWQESLFALVGQTPRGIWTVEARTLYDLQKVCVDHEREIYTVDLVEWALSWGRRPIKRHLPSQRDVLMLKHLRSVAKRLSAVRISDDQRRQLAALVHEAMDRIERRLRERLRPRISSSLDEVGLVPQNPPERVARKKLVEELLDQICERGFLAMGDLRDAISRNNLKLADLSGWFEVLHGDKLLRADRKLALRLDGVYRRGEFYLRWMQRLSSLSFGTSIGRFLTRFAAVPFGGAYVALAGIHHVLGYIAGEETAEAQFHLTSSSMVLSLGLFLLCLVNFAVFRRAVSGFFTASFHAIRFVTVEPIRWIVQLPLLQRIVRSREFRLLYRFVVKPLVWTGIAWCLLPERYWRNPVLSGTAIFLAVNLLLNSRAGQTVEEVVLDELAEGWRRFGLRLITGLFWFIVDVFRRIVQTVERLMYSVDEWLRFRSGENRRLLLVKAVLGLLWFFVAYILRFAVNVLIEPQINPIKHFPVVTVSHKLLLPLIPGFAGVLELTMEKGWAWTVAGTVITSIPGVFGFLVWELKENWRLYAANRRRDVGPVVIGSHGETAARLLKPGFHSGTLPKRCGKLRRAERHARVDGNWRAVHKHLRALRHIELMVRRCVQREFLELFAESKCWQGPSITLDDIRLGTNCIRLSLSCREVADERLTIEIQSQAGWLLARATAPSWADLLLPQQRRVLVTAMLGIYKVAGIELVRQQIESEFPPPPPPWYDVSAKGLAVWPDEQRDVEAFYDLHEGPWIAPQTVRGLSPRRLPTVERWQFVFSAIPLEWDRWVEVWNEDVAGQGHPRDPIVPVQVLPP